jgi:hypothetical protein
MTEQEKLGPFMAERIHEPAQRVSPDGTRKQLHDNFPELFPGCV